MGSGYSESYEVEEAVAVESLCHVRIAVSSSHLNMVYGTGVLGFSSFFFSMCIHRRCPGFLFFFLLDFLAYFLSDRFLWLSTHRFLVLHSF